MIMYKEQPIFDPSTHYWIEVRGRMDVDWLQSFDSMAEITYVESGRKGGITVLNVHTDQSGIVGLIRTLHGLGLTILKLQIVADGGIATEFEDHN
jgi:hypothetical protein